MKCSICGQERPSGPHTVVEAVKRSDGMVTARINSHQWNIGTMEHVTRWANEWSDVNCCELHWHWRDELFDQKTVTCCGRQYDVPRDVWAGVEKMRARLVIVERYLAGVNTGEARDLLEDVRKTIKTC
jgi:hypothetical protein